MHFVVAPGIEKVTVTCHYDSTNDDHPHRWRRLWLIQQPREEISGLTLEDGCFCGRLGYLKQPPVNLVQ